MLGSFFYLFGIFKLSIFEISLLSTINVIFLKISGTKLYLVFLCVFKLKIILFVLKAQAFNMFIKFNFN
ncbi:hypothetical protein EGI26_08270 [Lacihabitans sp. CCS-44]|nr:hypothetical protein [Lacihabitans sp. CCS-44]